MTCDTWPNAKLPPEFSGVAEGLAGVLQLKDMMSPRGVATRTCDASGENETEGEGGRVGGESEGGGGGGCVGGGGGGGVVFF